VSGAGEVLLDANEPGAYELIRPTGTSPIVLVCDHASNRVPARLHRLGLNDEQLQSHIAWDPGAAALARKLSARLDATLVLSNYSRLVIDLNRTPGHVQSIPAISAGIEVPGNSDITELEALRRRRSLFDPYQQAIASVLGRRDTDEIRLLSIHSFTPNLNGENRLWSIGVCYDQSVEWARKMLTGLSTRLDTEEDPIGDNEPYEVTDESDYTLPVQGKKHGIASLMLELRQDKISDEVMVQRWCNIIAGCCEFSV